MAELSSSVKPAWLIRRPRPCGLPGAFLVSLLRQGNPSVGVIDFSGSAVIVMAQGDLGMRFRQLPLRVLGNLIHYGAQYAWFSALLLIPITHAFLGAVLILAANSLNLIKARDPT